MRHVALKYQATHCFSSRVVFIGLLIDCFWGDRELDRLDDLRLDGILTASTLLVSKAMTSLSKSLQLSHPSSCRNENGGSALEQDCSCDGNTLSEGIWKPGTSGRKGPLTGRDGKVSAIPATPHRQNSANGEKDSYPTHPPNNNNSIVVTAFTSGPYNYLTVVGIQRRITVYKFTCNQLMIIKKLIRLKCTITIHDI